MGKIVGFGLSTATLLIVSGIASGFSFELQGAMFKTGHPLKGETLESAAASKDEIANLNRSVRILEHYPFTTFEVAGFTDQHECSGSVCHQLALRRALLVYRFLLDNGIDPHRVTSLTEHGPAMPIAGPEECQRNQRAEINPSLEP